MAIRSLDEIQYIRSYRDLNVDFKNNPITKDIYAVKNQNAIVQAIKNIVQTRFGERLMQPTIGCSVYEMLFEPLDVFSGIELQSRITTAISNYENRIEIIEMQVSIIEDDDTVLIDMTYRIIGEPNVLTNQFVLERPTN